MQANSFEKFNIFNKNKMENKTVIRAKGLLKEKNNIIQSNTDEENVRLLKWKEKTIELNVWQDLSFLKKKIKQITKY